MNPLKWMFMLALVVPIVACGGNNDGGDAATEVEQQAEAAYESTKESAQEAKEETAEAMDEARDSDAWDTTKERAKEAWVATKEFSMEAWETVRESFKGDMTPEEKLAFDDCVARLQQVEGLTKDQAERGCWRMMEEDTTEDYYAGEPDSDFWADAKEGASKAWEQTKESSKEAWQATKQYSQEAWQQVRDSFIGDMTPHEKKVFDACVKRLQKEEGLTEEQAERGCWRMLEEAEQSESSGN